MKTPAFPDGHFYSPVVDADEATRDRNHIWPHDPQLPGIDFRRGFHADLLMRKFPKLLKGYEYSLTGPEDTDLDSFYENNTQFANLDPRVCFCMLKMIRPKRIIEVGSGYSTLLMMDVNERFLDNATSITSIEPYPRPFLSTAHAQGRIRLVQKRVQDVAIFDQLDSGDILFIDSSHVSKTGSDVNYLFLQVLPRLKPGVFVHVHDIFFPSDYPERWIVDEGRSWSEQYILQAFLAFNNAFQVIFGVGIARAAFPNHCQAFVGNRNPWGGSFWMQRKPGPVMSAAGDLALLPGKFRRVLGRLRRRYHLK
jgi:hypothetical protein